MIKEFSVRALAQLMDELHSIDYQVSDPLEKMKSSLKIVRTAITKLRMLCTEQGFSSEEEEVHFFKNIKPDFYGQQILLSSVIRWSGICLTVMRRRRGCIFWQR